MREQEDVVPLRDAAAHETGVPALDDDVATRARGEHRRDFRPGAGGNGERARPTPATGPVHDTTREEFRLDDNVRRTDDASELCDEGLRPDGIVRHPVIVAG
jgi:hypothetical protein